MSHLGLLPSALWRQVCSVVAVVVLGKQSPLSKYTLAVCLLLAFQLMLYTLHTILPCSC